MSAPAMARTIAAALACLAIAAHAASTMAVRVLDWLLPVPANWTPQVPSSEMRLAQFTIASEGGAADAAVFHFGLGRGGSPEANIQRWATQFLGEDGKPATPKVEKATTGGMPVTWVSLDGRYARGVGTGPQGEAKARQSLRVAIVETEKGNLFFQLWGDEAAIAKQYPLMRTIVSQMKKAP